MSFAGFYINLDKSTDRDAKMRAQLEALSLADRYSRFPAVDGATQSGLTSPRSAGEVGCFMSHLRLLQQAIGGANHLHVMEDDAILSRRAAEVIDRVINTGTLQEYDIILTDADLGTDMHVISHLKKFVSVSAEAARRGEGPVNIRVVDVSNMNFCCMSSYLVNKNSLQKISDLLEAGVAAAIPTPVDLFLRFLANKGALRVGVTVPFVTSVPLYGRTPSTIQTNGDMSRLATTLLRRALFLDWDESADLEEVAQYPKPKTDGRDELILTATKLMLSPDYVIV